MRLKLFLGCLPALLLVLSPALAVKAAEAQADDAPPCMKAASDEAAGCCVMHGERGQGRGMMGGQGCGMGAGGAGCCGGCAERMAADPEFRKDHELFFFLLDHRADIHREVKMLEDGVETVTESRDKEVAGIIQEHVGSMYGRVDEGRPIHQRDPLFAELFRQADKIRMNVTPTKRGVRVTETSEDPHVVELIQAHAAVVTQFLENGFEEMHRNHAVPGAAEEGVTDGGCPFRGRMAGGE